MNEERITSKRLASSIVGLVLALGVLAWFDELECDDTSVASSEQRHVALVVDRSGSMEFLVQDVVDNVNAMLNSLRQTDRISILFFEDPYGVVSYVENRPVGQVPRLGYEDYLPLGGTPLYDAVGVAITDVIVPTVGAGKPSRFGVVIVLSDGEENASVRYSLADARQAVASALTRGIDIRFYGMGPAAAGEASALGIPIDNALQVDPTSAGLDEAFEDLQRSLGQTNAEQC